MRPFACFDRFTRSAGYRPAVLAARLAGCLAALLLATVPAFAQLSTAGSLLLQQGSAGIPGTADGVEHFGHALAAGDFDGDGRDDLAIGAPFENDAPVNGVGAVTIVYFAAGLPVGTSSELVTLESLTAETASEGDGFGRALATGDFDADGFADLAIGLPGRRVQLGGGAIADGAGAIIVLSGTSSGLDESSAVYLHREVAGFNGAAAADDRLGAALAVGDFDHDGFDDLGVGAPGDDVVGFDDNGAVNVLYGSAAGLSLARDQIWIQNDIVVNGDEHGDQFGSALAAGDFDGNGFDDLAIGVPYENYVAVADAGAIYQLIGSAAGLATGSGAPFVVQETIAAGGSEAGDWFGLKLAAGDLDGDGLEDLLVGSPGEDYDDPDFTIADTGRVHVLSGTPGVGAAPGAAVALDRDDFDFNVSLGDRFGSTVAIGRFAAGAGAGIAIGVPFVDVDVFQDAGTVFVADGPSFDPLASPQAFSQAGVVPGVEESGDRLGEALAVGDFDGNGFDDLAVAVPYEGVGAIPEAGAVNILWSAGLFRDGFESADSAAWSNAVAN